MNLRKIQRYVRIAENYLSKNVLKANILYVEGVEFLKLNVDVNNA
jgi:hypothetical protein